MGDITCGGLSNEKIKKVKYITMPELLDKVTNNKKIAGCVSTQRYIELLLLYFTMTKYTNPSRDNTFTIY